MSTAIGIDLGLTNSRVAASIDGQPMVIQNADGRRSTPSAVALNPKSGERIVGTTAQRQAVTNPDNTIIGLKRFIGKRYDDRSVQRDRYLVGYRVEPLPNGDAGIVFDGELRPPAEIAAMVIRDLKEYTEFQLGDRVSHAVIAVPANFNQSQRDATRRAAKMAGLQVMRIMTEPNAAAQGFGIEVRSGQKVAVFSLGAASFDFTILGLGDRDLVEVMCSESDDRLGGDDFDDKVVDWMVETFKAKEKIDLRKIRDRSPMQRLQSEAERVKIELSSEHQSDVNVPFLIPREYGAFHFAETLTRAEFERRVAGLVELTIAPCEQALWDAELTVRDIGEVLLVGGGTWMPVIRRRVRRFFGNQPNVVTAPEDAVVLGAARLADMLFSDFADRKPPPSSI